KCGDARLGQRADTLGRAERIGEADRSLAPAQPRRISRHGANLQENVGGSVDGIARRVRRSGLLVRGGRETRGDSGILLDDHVEACFLQCRGCRWNQRNAVLARERLSRNAYFHGLSLPGSITTCGSTPRGSRRLSG